MVYVVKFVYQDIKKLDFKIF